jgi:hypothetical protein
MRSHIFLTSLLLFSSISLFAQKFTVSGKVTDASSGESLIGVNILFKEGVGVVSDFDGNFSYSLESGVYNITVSYVGYTKVTQNVTINGPTKINFQLNSIVLDEVKVTADVAIARKTPIAFTNIEPKQLQENLASQDIPMILNATPGVYATHEGGGDGDAQITIRGFSSRNVGVLLDGVPVNDMETGQVYWSNWFGLDVATRSIQVQRGLGASKLALPSVGGTINIITKGYENKKGGELKQEIGADGYLRTTLGYNTGKLKNDWAFSVAGSYKRGNGWVDQTWTEGYFYYFKADKKINNHLISFSAFGAPQSHAQRSYKLPIMVYDSAYAVELGMTASDIDSLKSAYGLPIDLGMKFNQHWGYLDRNNTTDTITPGGSPFNEKINEYHKPQFTLKDSWKVNDQLFISNILYMSIGRGGGITSKSTPATEPDGQMSFQGIYFNNVNKDPNPLYDTVGRMSGASYLVERKNEHMWYGLVSTANYTANSLLNISGGIDLRMYKGTHFEEIYDLVGADYIQKDQKIYGPYPPDIDYTQPEPLKSYTLRVGDKDYYYNDGLVNWGGIFLLGELDLGKINAFLNLTSSITGYKRIDHFYGINPAIKQGETDWKYIPGYTIKTGANYLLSERINIFGNFGYLNKAPRFNNVYDRSNLLWQNIEQEVVIGTELGSGYKSSRFSCNVNAYYTMWKNKPLDFGISVPDANEPTLTYSANIKGLDALHKGIELDFIYKLSRKLSFQGLMSLGNWKWNSADTVYVYNDEGILYSKEYFNAKGVHVGNAAQTQFSGEIRYEPMEDLYFKAVGTFFDRYYAEFDPFSLKDDSPEDSWRIPSYLLLDFHTGYGFTVYRNRFQIRGSILNLLDKKYIATAQNNDKYNRQPFNTNDARSASVFMGIGRKYNISLQWYF